MTSQPSGNNNNRDTGSGFPQHASSSKPVAVVFKEGKRKELINGMKQS